MEKKPGELYADSAYDTESTRRYLESIGIEPEYSREPKEWQKT
jgi:hypothetical protein